MIEVKETEKAKKSLDGGEIYLRDFSVDNELLK